MSFTMSGAVTGATVTGLTSPTYTLTADTTTDDARQSVVSALGGTQTGVISHSVSAPFTVTVTKPKSLRTLGKANLNGLISNVGRNTYGILIRKGAVPLAGQPYQIALIRCNAEIPAGSELNDKPNLAALASFFGGFANSNADGWYNTWLTALL